MGHPPNQKICEDFINCLLQFEKTGAQCEVEINKQDTGSDVVVRIQPASHNAAPIEARLELDFGVYLLLGVSAQFEIPFSKGYYTGLGWLAELDMLCRAVANGNFREHLVYIGRKVIYSKHQLILENGKTIRESWGIRPILPWRRTHVIEQRYVPYGSE